MFKKVDVRQSLPKMEEEILKYWEENKTFEKSVSNRAGAPVYSFYDGPPFATGLPHYGHIVGQALKDAVPRYWTMRGFQVERKWGWDCHGLPIENIAEKALGVKRKKDIEEMGVEKFNEFCRSTVLQYTEEWKKVTMRLGRWADRDHAYKTMDKDYMESVWWVFKQLWDKGLIYEGYRIMHICTRCETTLSQSEVSEGYKDVKDLSATVKFELITSPQSSPSKEEEAKTFILAWTTTPWTLPGNVALAVGKDIEYARVKIENEFFICAKNLAERVFAGKEYKIDATFLGKDLIGKKYLPPFDSYYKNEDLENYKNGWKVYGAEFVTTEEGTGVVHIAPAFGEDDMNLGKAEKLPFIQHVGMDGIIKSDVKELTGLSVKSKENPQATDIEVIKYLAEKGLLFAKEKYEHSYPHCWRCDTPLINYATSSWFVKVTDVKEKALETADAINWSPEHVKAGRFGKWLEGARDWSISRQRFWASVIPVWKCEQCAVTKVFGSVKELEEISGEKITDLHKHSVDKIIFPCEKCNGLMKRIPDVLDTWFDSGSMPYAQMHYPFENKEKFERSFPAQFIAEGIDQTRAWFYYLHVLGTALTGKSAFQNVIVNGIVQAEDGKKMSKRLNNYPDPMLMFEKYGADAMRLYLLSSPIVSAENLNFSEKDMSEISRNVFRMLWNSYSFFVMYAEIDEWSPSIEASAHRGQSENILDKWVLSELQLLIKEVNGYMESYDMMRATRAFASFIDNLSNWYIRRSRKRFWKSEDDSDKANAYQTLHTVLVTLAKLMAPFTPFIAEEIYRNLTGEESVHLTEYPVADEGLIDEKLNEEMRSTRNIITEGLQLRAKEKIKVRQPLVGVSIRNQKINKELLEIMKDELNVKHIDLQNDQETMIILDTIITPELKLEGQAREIIRFVQETRKEVGFEVDDRIEVGYQGFEGVFENPELLHLIAKEVLAEKGLHWGEIIDADIRKEAIIDDMKISLWIKRV
jgi:isoleucyl-tRNA synthetase